MYSHSLTCYWKRRLNKRIEELLDGSVSAGQVLSLPLLLCRSRLNETGASATPAKPFVLAQRYIGKKTRPVSARTGLQITSGSDVQSCKSTA